MQTKVHITKNSQSHLQDTYHQTFFQRNFQLPNGKIFAKNSQFTCSMLIEELLTPYLSQLLLYQNISKNFMKVVIAIKWKYVRFVHTQWVKILSQEVFFSFLTCVVLVRSVFSHCEKYCKSAAKGYWNSTKFNQSTAISQKKLSTEKSKVIN